MAMQPKTSIGELPRCATASIVAALWLLAFHPSARLSADAPAHDSEIQSRQQSAAAILAKHCVECRGGRLTRSGIDLTTREGLLKGGAGGDAFLPGEVARSPLYERIAHKAEPGMPYKRQKLAEDEIARVKAWLEDGAGYSGPLRKPEAGDEWWSLKPLVKPAVPPPQSAAEVAWAKTPVDLFVLAKYREKRLSPAAPADKRTLLRRVMFDLVGLPPTPEETADFLADDAPDAYEQLVERLLASP